MRGRTLRIEPIVGVARIDFGVSRIVELLVRRIIRSRGDVVGTARENDDDELKTFRYVAAFTVARDLHSRGLGVTRPGDLRKPDRAGDEMGVLVGNLGVSFR